MSGDHVDVVKNEWLAGWQVLVARVTVNEGELRIRAKDQAWEEIVRRPLLDKSTSQMIDSVRNPQRFIEVLPGSLTNSYFFATELHSDEKCPFAVEAALRLDTVDLKSLADG